MTNKNLLTVLPQAVVREPVSKKTVVLMDSSSERGKYLAMLLSEAFSVQLVRNSTMVPEFLGTAPDILLIDMSFPMPGSVNDFITGLRNNARFSKTIIALLSDVGGSSMLLSGLQAGAHTYIIYPLNAELLLLTMEKLVSLKDSSAVFNTNWLVHPSVLQQQTVTPHIYEDAFRKKFEAVVSKYIGDEIPSVRKISDEMAQSSATLVRWVKKIYGVTPKKYIMDHKLYIAEMMLRHKSGSVRDIAYKLGFHSVSYFCYLFKEKYKCSPGSLLGRPNE